MAVKAGRNAFRVALYARVSTHDQQTLPMQLDALREYAARRGWEAVLVSEEVGSGAKRRPKREEVLRLARARLVDAVLVWRLDRWGRSLSDLVTSLEELAALGVGFVSLAESLDFTTPAGRALVGMLAVFAQFERELIVDRVRAGIAEARKRGTRLGRPPSARLLRGRVEALAAKGLSKGEIARRLKIGRTSVRRLLGAG